MLQIKMSPPSSALNPYIWSYGATTGRVDSAPLLVPLPARPKQSVVFNFADNYRLVRSGSTHTESTSCVTAVGLQSCVHPGLSIFGNIDNFTIHFQPSGFNRLFGIPMTELTDGAFDAHAVLGQWISSLRQELGEANRFADRILITEKHLMQLANRIDQRDPVAMAANNLFASHGMLSVSRMAAACELSTRQFERRFLALVGLPPKFYSRIVKFNAVLDNKLHLPDLPWSHIASDHDYYDQMHFVRDCRDFTGQPPSHFLKRMESLPEFSAYFANANRARRS